ncbi:MAG: biotin/lipoyl-containing protein [Candidatus Nanopelagicales bacterium]
MVTANGDTRPYDVARAGTDVWLAADGVTERFTETERLAAEGGAAGTAGVGAVHSPMPGTVIAVAVAAGDRVAEGAPLVTVEAMKMEHTLTAPAACDSPRRRRCHRRAGGDGRVARPAGGRR